jgi:hypothetical protein
LKDDSHKKLNLIESHGWPLKVIADGAIGTRGMCGGRLIPVVIVDTTRRPEVDELIRLHTAVETPGDVNFQWGGIDGHDHLVVLCLTFCRPLEARLIIQFEIVRQGCLVEQILFAKSLYIQSGREGDRIKTDVNAPKVLIELPDVGFKRVWDSIFREHLERYFRKHKRLGRAAAKSAAARSIDEWKKAVILRMPDLPD